MTATQTAASARSWESYEALFEGVGAPFAFVDLDALWANAAEMLGRGRGGPRAGAGARQADPGGEQVGPLPAAARGHPGARRVPGADDLHPGGGPLVAGGGI